MLRRYLQACRAADRQEFRAAPELRTPVGIDVLPKLPALEVLWYDLSRPLTEDIMRADLAVCCLLAGSAVPAAAEPFVNYKVCHGEKREVCNQHREFVIFEGCTNSAAGGEGDLNPQWSCQFVCGVSSEKPGICAVAPPRYELNNGDKCMYSWFLVKCSKGHQRSSESTIFRQ